MTDTFIHPTETVELGPIGADLCQSAGGLPKLLVVLQPNFATDTLGTAVGRLVQRGPAQFHVVAPIRLPSAAQSTVFGDAIWCYGFVGDLCEWSDDDTVRSDAEAHVDHIVGHLHRAGALATGEVSNAPCLVAASAAAAACTFDGIVVCGRRRWLARLFRVDLGQRLARRTGLPVVYV